MASVSCSDDNCPVEMDRLVCALLNVLQRPILSSHGEDISLLYIYIRYSAVPNLSKALANHNQDQCTYRIRVSLEYPFVQHGQGNTGYSEREGRSTNLSQR